MRLAEIRKEQVVEHVVFESRWMLLPLIVGMIVALAVYVVRFLANTWSFVAGSWHHDMESVVVEILGLVDAFMVANLLIMIAKGSYHIFIHKFDHEKEKPGWLDHIDTGLLKVKVSQSIAAITGVALLKDFVNIERLEWLVVEHRMVVHVVCLASAVLMAWIWRITHSEPTHAPEEHHAH
jgi:uncharacterized protein (TIGR00645 family)